eukprot:gene25527-33321_t
MRKRNTLDNGITSQETYKQLDGSWRLVFTTGDYPVLKFYGKHQWFDKPRKLEFDFDVIQVFGFKINLPKGGAATIGSTTGLGSEENIKLINKNRKPFFNWISASDDYATARGGGGGLALWKRTYE